ncbi:MAG: cytochrome c3 family protein [Planctomycetota bacterium]
MSQLFSKAADTILRTALVGAVGLAGVVGSVMFAVARSPYVTDQNVTVEQPVPFSHQHHVGDIGIDCRYCHQTVETSARAGVPSTQVCMNCHRDLWNQSDMLAPVRDSFRDNRPLLWNRVHDLPDYVYFNHSIHIHQGIGCYSCHGDVSEMPLLRRDQPLTMQWCLDCHRNPEKHVRPRDLVFVTKPLDELAARDEVAAASPTVSVEKLREHLAEEFELESKTNCYTCHR